MPAKLRHEVASFVKSLAGRKSLTDIMQQADQCKLKRTLGPRLLIAVGIGAIIGTGILELVRIGAGNHSASTMAFSFLLAGVTALFTALSFAELASMMPVAGAAYIYGYAAMGELTAWMIGWNLMLEFLLGSATIAVRWSRIYTTTFLKDIGANFNSSLVQAPFNFSKEQGLLITGGYVNLPAVLLVVVITALLMYGSRDSMLVNMALVCIKVAVIIVFLVMSSPHISVDHWRPWMTSDVWNNSLSDMESKSNQTDSMTYYDYNDTVAVMLSANNDTRSTTPARAVDVFEIFSFTSTVFFAFIGFDAVATAAQEARKPRSDLPKGILMSLITSIMLYVGFILVLTGNIDRSVLRTLPWFEALCLKTEFQQFCRPIEIGAVIGLPTVLLVLLMAQSRIFFSMAQDGLLPPFFSKIHCKYRTPYVATLITGVVSAVLSGVFPIEIMLQTGTVGTLSVFVLVNVCVIVLRWTHPEAERHFLIPAGWMGGCVIPGFGALLSLSMIVSAKPGSVPRLLAWMAVGLVVYFCYGYRHSHLRKTRQRVAIVYRQDWHSCTSNGEHNLLPVPVPPTSTPADYINANASWFPASTSVRQEWLGEGAFGEVYKWWDPEHHRVFAGKETTRDRAVREIGTLRSLHHPHVVDYYGYRALDSDTVVIFMEYMPGGALLSVIEKNSTGLNELKVMEYTAQVLEGLKYVHEKGILHLDLKCDNLLLDGKGNLKIADFGIAIPQNVRTNDSNNCTTTLLRTFSTHGSIYFCAPEMLTGNVVGRRADIWSLGCTIVEMFTKKPPHAHLSPRVFVAEHHRLSYDPAALLPAASSQIKQFLSHLLERSLADRPRAVDAAQLLRDIFHQQPPHQPLPPPVSLSVAALPSNTIC